MGVCNSREDGHAGGMSKDSEFMTEADSFRRGSFGEEIYSSKAAAPLNTSDISGYQQAALEMELPQFDADYEAYDSKPAAPVLSKKSSSKKGIRKKGIRKRVDRSKEFPIHAAVVDGKEKLAEVLKKAKKSKLNEEDARHSTPLTIACQRRALELVTMLLKAKADVKYKSKSDESQAIHYASGVEDNADVINLLIESKAKVNSTMKYQNTALHTAALNGRTKNVTCLLEHKADVDPKYKNGDSPLFMAASKGFSEVVDVLVEAKANVESRNQDGEISLAYASQYGHNKIVEKLLAHAADPNAADEKQDSSPLYLASSFGHTSVAKLLVTSKANIHYQKAGLTCLHRATIRGHVDTVDLLLSANIDATVQSKAEGDNALHMAINANQRKMIDMLIPHFLELSATNKKGWTVFDYAIRVKQKPLEIVASLAKKFVFPEARFLTFSNLRSVRELDSGAYGIVYKADLFIGDTADGEALIPVVCKVSKVEAGPNEWHELQILQNIPNHPNVLGLLAMCTGFEVENTKRTAMILIFKEGGSLLAYLKSKKGRLSLMTLVRYGIDMARGIDHLHKNQVKHSDVAARNFLLTEKHSTNVILPSRPVQVLALTDFGLARPVEFQHADPPPLPVKWCGPEVFESLGKKITIENDVWMLGVTFFEMSINPYIEPLKPFPVTCLPKIFESGKSICFLKGQPHQKWKEVIDKCCRFDPKDRPTAQQLLEMLETMLVELEENSGEEEEEKSELRDAEEIGDAGSGAEYDDVESLIDDVYQEYVDLKGRKLVENESKDNSDGYASAYRLFSDEDKYIKFSDVYENFDPEPQKSVIKEEDGPQEEEEESQILEPSENLKQENEDLKKEVSTLKQQIESLEKELQSKS